MVLTNKERQARYRAKKKNAESYDEFKKKEAERKAISRSRGNMTEEQFRQYRLSENARIRQFRQKRMAQEKDVAPLIVKMPYRSRQSEGKALKKAMTSLPKSPRKRAHIVSEVARSAGLAIKPTKTHSSKNKNALNDELRNKIVNFYSTDDISWQAPGRKDRTIIRWRNIDGQRQKTTVQTRYMLTSLSEAHESFLKQTTTSVSRSKFCELRPKNVKLFDSIPHNVCVCVYHENIRLLLLSLTDCTNPPLPNNTTEFVDSLVCDTNSKECMAGECAQCKDNIDAYLVNDSTACQKYQQWQRSDTFEKNDLEGSASEIFKLLKTQTGKFLLHEFTKNQQSAWMKTVQTQVNGDRVLVQVDFSENATIGFQNEIQSVHWTHRQATIFTCFVWVTSGITESIVIVSDELNHTKLSVHYFMSMILALLKQKYSSISRIDIFSDGASSQFKQKFLFSNLQPWETEFGFSIRWHFFATSHGKGVVDGLGGTIKRTVWRQVRAGKANPLNPREFSVVAAERNPGMNVIFVSSEAIHKREEELLKRWDTVLPVPNTQRIHSVGTDGPFKILVGETSKNGSERSASIFNVPPIDDSTIPVSACGDRANVLPVDDSIIPVSACGDRATVCMDLHEEHYFAVYFTDPMTFYIGRVIDIHCTCDLLMSPHLKMKFLKEDLISGKFGWPRRCEMECVPRQCVFAGPVNLIGSCPFVVPELSAIEEQFLLLKKQF